MKVRVLSTCLTIVIALGTATPLAAGAIAADRDAAKAQVEFGIKVAQKKLWREATYRFEKAVEMDPTYAAAWNNLAIAYEEQGKFPEADKAYKKAVEIDPDNVLIQQNYELFKEFYGRLEKRRR